MVEKVGINLFLTTGPGGPRNRFSTFLEFRKFKVPEGHHPRGTTLREALRGNCLSEGSAGVSQRALRGLSEGSAGSLRRSAGVRGIFRGFRV